MAAGGQGDDAIELKAARAVLLDVIELGAREHHPITLHSPDRAILDVGVHPRGHFVVLIYLTPHEDEDIGVVVIGDLFGIGILLREVVSGGTYVYNDAVAFCSFCNKGLLRKAITLDEKESQYTHKRKGCHNPFKKAVLSSNIFSGAKTFEPRSHSSPFPVDVLEQKWGDEAHYPRGRMRTQNLH